MANTLEELEERSKGLVSQEQIDLVNSKEPTKNIEVKPVKLDPNNISKTNFESNEAGALEALFSASKDMFTPSYNPEKIKAFFFDDPNIRNGQMENKGQDVDFSSLNVLRNPGVIGDFINDIDIDLGSLKSEKDVVATRRAPNMSLAEIFKYKYDEFNKVAAVRGSVGYYASIGKLSKEEAQTVANRASLEFYKTEGELKDYAWSTSAVRMIVGESGNQAALWSNMLYGGLKTAKDFALAAGGATLLAGQAGPQAALLEEVVTVPAAMSAAFGVGMAYGGLSGMYKIEAGNMYLDMVDNNVDVQAASLASIIYGAASVFIESIALSKIPPTKTIMKKVGKTMLNKTTQKAITQVAIGFSRGVAIEVTEEVLTEGVGIISKYIAESVSENPTRRMTTKQAFADIKETFLRAVAGSVGFGIASGALNTRQFYRGVKEEFDAKLKKAKEEVAKERAKESADLGLAPEEKQEVKGEPLDFEEKFKQKVSDFVEQERVLEAEIAEAKVKKKGVRLKGTKLKENKLQKIRETRETISDIQKELSADAFGDKTDFAKVVNTIDLGNLAEISPDELRVVRHKAVEESVRQTLKSIKEGEVLLKGQATNVQTRLRKLIFNSELEIGPKERLQINNKIKNINSLESMKKELPDLLKDVVDISEKFQTRVFKDDIKKSLKRGKLVKAGKFPKGKFQFEQQEVFDTYSKHINKSQKTINDELISAEMRAQKDLNDGVRSFSPEDLLNVEVLRDVQRIKDNDLKRIKDISSGLKELAAEGKTQRLLKELKREIEFQKAKELLIDNVSITPGQVESLRVVGEDEVLTRVKEDQKAVKRSLHSVMSHFGTWDTVIEQLNLNNKEGFTKEFEVFKAEAKYKTGYNESVNVFNEILTDTLGKKVKEGKVDETFMVDDYLVKNFGKKENVGSYYDAANQVQELDLTRSEARYMFSIMQDESLHGRLKKLGYTFINQEDSLGGVSTERLVNDFLTEEDFTVIESLAKFYDTYYTDKLNPAYRDKFGATLPKRKNYTPVSSIGDKSKQDVDMFADPFTPHRTSILPSQIQTRASDTFGELKIGSDLDVLQNYVSSSEHFLAWDDTVQKFNRVFKDPVVKKLLAENYGVGFVKNLDRHVESFTLGSARVYNDFYNSQFKKLVNNFGITRLALKPALYAKQLTSTFAYYPYVGADGFIDGLRDFALNMPEAIKILSETDFMKDRKQAGLSKDLAIAKKLQKQFLSSKGMSYTELMLLPTKFGDRSAIYAGGWTVYRDAIKKDLGHKKAVELFSRATQQTQQSGDLSQLSAWQKSSNPFAIMGSQFVQSPNQYFNANMRSFLRAARFRTKKDIEDFLVASFIYSVVLPVSYQTVAYAGKLSKGDIASAVIGGSLNGIFLFGNIVQWAIRGVTKAYVDEERTGTRPPITPVIDFFAQAGEAAFRRIQSGVLEEGMEAADYSELLFTLADMGGALKAIPAGRVIDVARSETLPEFALKAYGFSDWAVKEVFNIDNDDSFKSFKF